MDRNAVVGELKADGRRGLVDDAVKETEQWRRLDQDYPQDDEEEDDDGGDYDEEPVVPATRAAPTVGRNAPCPCGSGKKYKKCCAT